jgi:hypothetical protein
MVFLQQKFNESRPMAMQTFGSRNADKIFYVIYRPKFGSGFFSNVFHVMGHLMVAQAYDLTPVVDMENFPVLYNEKEPIDNIQNAWEYYFHQPGGFRLEEVYESKNVLFCDGRFIEEIYDNVKAEGIVRQFLRIKEYVVNYANEFYVEHFAGHVVLSVHFRGQEQKKAPGHPACPTTDQMLERTEKLLKTYCIDKIFFVSEEQSYLELFKSKFGSKVFATDAFRTYDINAYHLRPYPRRQHMYRLGLDVLRDTLLLARADYLLASGNEGIASGSNVSQMAQVLNNGNYRHVELIYNGMNPHEKTTVPFILKRFKRALKHVFCGEYL